MVIVFITDVRKDKRYLNISADRCDSVNADRNENVRVRLKRFSGIFIVFFYANVFYVLPETEAGRFRFQRARIEPTEQLFFFRIEREA